MNIEILIPLFLGMITIIQGAINKQMATKLGLIQTALVGSTVTLIICVFAYLGVKTYANSVSPIFQIKSSLFTYEWWFIIPAIFGFFIVTGMPFAIYKIGAVKVTVGLVAAQMVTSTIWDIYVEGIELNYMKTVGIIFALASVVCIQFSK